jgi:hypothetical protein
MWFFCSLFAEQLFVKTPIREDHCTTCKFLSNLSLSVALKSKYCSWGDSRAKTRDSPSIRRYLSADLSTSLIQIMNGLHHAPVRYDIWWNIWMYISRTHLHLSRFNGQIPIVSWKESIQKNRIPGKSLFRRVCSGGHSQFNFRMPVYLSIWGASLMLTRNFHITNRREALFVREKPMTFKITEVIRPLSIPRLFNCFTSLQ